jgi:hypothetical protein
MNAARVSILEERQYLRLERIDPVQKGPRSTEIVKDL